MSVDRQHPAEPMDAVDEFLRDVEHGQDEWAWREVQLRLEVEGETRRRIRAAVKAERQNGVVRARWLVAWTLALAWLSFYNVVTNGLSWPW